MIRHALLALGTTLCLTLLAACGQQAPVDSSQTAHASSVAEASDGFLGGMIDQAMDHASQELVRNDLTLADTRGDAPMAAITPQGDFLIDGKAVAITAAQRAQLLDYRKQVIKVASQGIRIGKQGARLGLDAAGNAFSQWFGGDPNGTVRAQLKAQAEKLKQAAHALCAQLPMLAASQAKLARELPAFRPYARSQHVDIENCHNNTQRPDKPGTAI